jgi:hypothetical protein
VSGIVEATTNAGPTDAAKNSQTTAAAQRDEEEEVAEVDEAAFQDLKNYDESPQGILMPVDQQFAYDDEGNIYFMVTLRGAQPYGVDARVPLYRVKLSLDSPALAGADYDTKDYDAKDYHLTDFSPSLVQFKAGRDSGLAGG